MVVYSFSAAKLTVHTKQSLLGMEYEQNLHLHNMSFVLFAGSVLVIASQPTLSGLSSVTPLKSLQFYARFLQGNYPVKPRNNSVSIRECIQGFLVTKIQSVCLALEIHCDKRHVW